MATVPSTHNSGNEAKVQERSREPQAHQACRHVATEPTLAAPASSLRVRHSTTLRYTSLNLAFRYLQLNLRPVSQLSLHFFRGCWM